MFTTKIIASLFLIATAGLLDAGRGLVGQDGAAQATTVDADSPARPTDARAKSLGDIRREVGRALALQVRKDMDDPALAVDVSDLTLRRGATDRLSVDGEAQVSLGNGAALPLRVEADWDAAGQRLERLDYRVSGEAVKVARPARTPTAAGTGDALPSATPVVGDAMRSAIEAKLEAGLAGEFSSQHPRFELVAIERIASGRYRMLVTGIGITRFPGEGAAFTRFSASIGKFDGRVAQADYELLQELDAPSLAAR